MKRILLYFLLGFLFSDSNAQPIAGGEYHSLFLCGNEIPRSCGFNASGELGDGTNTQRTIAVQVSGLTDVIGVAAGGSFSLFLKKDGTVWACGWNSYGQLGDGTHTSRNIAQQVIGLSGIIAIAAGYHHCLFLKNDGTVWACGGNTDGQLGDGTIIARSIVVQVPGLSGITFVAAGGYHSLFVKNDGTVWSCGQNTYGQLGDGTTIQRTTVVQVLYSTQIIAVGAGSYHSLFLKNDGTVWSCGFNDGGQLGDGTTTQRTIPVQVIGLTGVQSIAAGWNFSLFLKNDSTVRACGQNTFGALGDGTTFSRSTQGQVAGLYGVNAIAAGYYHSVFLKSDGTVQTCGRNSYGQLDNGTTIDNHGTAGVLNLCYVAPITTQYAHYIHGYLYNDSSHDCLQQLTEQLLPFIPVVSFPNNHFTFSNDSGYYSLGLNDSINFTIEPIIPQYLSNQIFNPCPSDYLINLNATTSHDTTGFDFGFDGVPCWQLRVDISGNRKRRCFRNYTTVHYWNDGLMAADTVTVRVKFAEYDIPISASLPYIIDIDSSLVFNIGTLQSFQSGTITITDSIACISGLVGLTQCTKARILPINHCLIDSTTGGGWDHSSVSVNGSCVNDTCRFVIYNNGSGNMTASSPYRIYANNVLVYTGSFQLQTGDSLVVPWVSGGATIRLEADQSPGHPGHSHPRYTLEACGTDISSNYSIGEVNRTPMDDEDEDVEIDCMQIRDSYDPNEKDNAPEGIDAAHIVLPNTQIDFIVHFQNTGTDTAYKVVVIDSLSNDLDLATLELGAGSHPYSVSLSGQGVPVLKFTFSNINLPDSTTDELNSSGFIKYKITPKSSTPLGTQINNAADIYFDYNFPVRTNIAFVILGNYLELSANDSRITKAGLIIFYPNPTMGSITLEAASNNLLNKVIVSGIDSRVIKSIAIGHSEKTTIDLKELSAGIYFLDCVGEKGSQKVKLVKY